MASRYVVELCNSCVAGGRSSRAAQKLAQYLLSGNMKIRQGVQIGKRVEYFKGRRLIEALLELTVSPRSGSTAIVELCSARSTPTSSTLPRHCCRILGRRFSLFLRSSRFLLPRQDSSKLPKVNDKAEALEIALRMLEMNFFHASERIKKGGILEPKQSTSFTEDGFYTWIYQGSQTMSNLATVALIVGFLFFTCFPIWPQFMKVWMWYLSVTFILLIFGIIIIRLFFFLLLWLVGYDFWILPRMWDETLGVLESFTPLYSLEKSAPGQMYWRLGFLGALVAFGVWAANQPTDFDTFISAQKDFLDDLYSGNLLSDTSQEFKDNIDKPSYPTLEELLRQEQEDAEAEAAGEKTDEEMEAEVEEMLDKLVEEDEDEDEDEDEEAASTEAS
eukprot:scaffold47_cov258-Pinguiococcus_pyrenoidosus.AAC.63